MIGINKVEQRLDRIDERIGMRYTDTTRMKIFEDLVFCRELIKNHTFELREIEQCVRQRDEIIQRYDARLKEMPESTEVKPKTSILEMSKLSGNASAEMQKLKTQLADFQIALATIASYQGTNIDVLKNIANFHLEAMDCHVKTESEVG